MSIGFITPLAKPAEVEVRFTVDVQGHRLQLSARTTEADIAALAECYGGDRQKAMLTIASAAWKEYYAPQMQKQT